METLTVRLTSDQAIYLSSLANMAAIYRTSLDAMEAKIRAGRERADLGQWIEGTHVETAAAADIAFSAVKGLSLARTAAFPDLTPGQSADIVAHVIANPSSEFVEGDEVIL